MKKLFLAAAIALVSFNGSMASPVNHSSTSKTESFYQTKKKTTKKPHKKHQTKKKSTVKKK